MLMDWFPFIDNFYYLEFKDLGEFIAHLLNLAISFSVVIVVFAVVIAGFKYMFSRGDDEKVKEATRGLLFAFIGLIIVFLSPTIVKFVIDKFL